MMQSMASLRLRWKKSLSNRSERSLDWLKSVKTTRRRKSRLSQVSSNRPACCLKDWKIWRASKHWVTKGHKQPAFSITSVSRNSQCLTPTVLMCLLRGKFKSQAQRSNWRALARRSPSAQCGGWKKFKSAWQGKVVCCTVTVAWNR